MQVPLPMLEGALVQMGFPKPFAALMIEMFKGQNAGLCDPQEPRSQKNTTPTTLEWFAREIFARPTRAKPPVPSRRTQFSASARWFYGCPTLRCRGSGLCARFARIRNIKIPTLKDEGSGTRKTNATPTHSALGFLGGRSFSSDIKSGAQRLPLAAPFPRAVILGVRSYSTCRLTNPTC